MSFRRYNIQSLIQSGQRIIPWKVEILYRYISDITAENQAYVNIYGSMYEANPVVLCQTDLLYIPTELEGGMTKFATEIININDKVEYGIYFDLYNSEYVEVKKISVLYRQGSIGSGHNANIDEDIVLLSFTINDGDLLTLDPELILHSTTIGIPTHYRVGKLSNCSDGIWTTYSTSVNYDGDIGVNKLYFQVKNSADTVSNILNASVVIEPKQFLQDIDDLRYNLDYDFVQTRNLDFEKDSSYNHDDLNWETFKTSCTSGDGWIPIGINIDNNRYQGSFDGAGFTIGNLYIRTTEVSNVGLFGVTEAGSTISNVNLVDVDIEVVATNLGGLVGLCNSNISGCSISGSIENIDSVSSNTGMLIGVIGFNEVTKCYSSGTVKNVRDTIGGLVGSALSSGSAIKDCYSNVNIIGNTDSPYWTCGISYANEGATIENCYFAGSIVSNWKTGICNIPVTSCYYNSDNLPGLTEGSYPNNGYGIPKSTIEMKTESTYIDWDFINTWKIVEDTSYPTLK